MKTQRLIVIGASGGGIETLQKLVAVLPADLDAAICVVIHIAPESPGVLDQILSRAGRLPASNAIDGERLVPRHIYIAPADRHLVIEPGKLRVTKGPRENRFRPAIDPLFRSAAQVYGPGVIGVILTGSLDDGTAGLWTVKQLGGTTIVQDPEDALYPGMPQSAINHVHVDYVLPLSDIAPLLAELTRVPVAAASPTTSRDPVDVEVKIAMEEHPLEAGLGEIAEPSVFACPECHGVLLQLKQGPNTRFRCHTGHAFSLESLVAAVDGGIEESLWNAVRALEEGELLLARMAQHLADQHQDDRGAKQLRERAKAVRQQSDAVRQLVLARDVLPIGER